MVIRCHIVHVYCLLYSIYCTVVRALRSRFGVLYVAAKSVKNLGKSYSNIPPVSPNYKISMDLQSVPHYPANFSPLSPHARKNVEQKVIYF